MAKAKKSPLLAALLNFVLLGAGYIYLGKRKAAGWLLVLAVIAMGIEFYFGKLSHLTNLAETHTISFTIVAIALALDAYLLAKEINEDKPSKEARK